MWKLLQLKDKTMSVIIGFVLERQPCLSEWQVAESFPVTPNDSDQEYALNITPKLYWPDSTTLQYNSIDTDTKEERRSWEMHKWGGTKREKILGAQKTQRKQKSKNWGMLLNEQTWETGLRPRQDKEGKGIHESSDEFHVWKIKSWKWWKEHTKERNEKREWAFENDLRRSICGFQSVLVLVVVLTLV